MNELCNVGAWNRGSDGSSAGHEWDALVCASAICTQKWMLELYVGGM